MTTRQRAVIILVAAAILLILAALVYLAATGSAGLDAVDHPAGSSYDSSKAVAFR